MSQNSFEKVLDAGVNSNVLTLKHRADLLKLMSKHGKDLPLGIRLLFDFMRKRKHDLLGYNLEEIAANKDKEVLGTGTFGVVMGDKTKKKKDTVWKVSTFPNDHFAKEIDALNALDEDDNDHEDEARNHLPRLVDPEATFLVKLGQIEYSLRCMELTPRGVPVLSLSNELHVPEVIDASKQISDAMRFLHSKGYIHSDISPKNIVVLRDDKTKQTQYVLADLGLATKITEQMKGFQGTVQYASEEIFRQYPNKEWSPKACHDEASLKYTIAALLSGAKSGWDMHPFPQSPKQKQEDRKEQMVLFWSVINKRESVVENLFSSNGVKWDEHNAKLVKKEGAAEAEGKVASNEQQHQPQQQQQQKKKRGFWGKMKRLAKKGFSN